MKNIYKKCAWHTCNKEAVHRFCSQQCKSKFYVDRRRKELKQKAIDYLGGKCKICGYYKCIRALDFHHKDPTTKDFGISKSGYTRSWEKVKAELDKCILLCCRCHKEVHAGITSC